MKLQFLFEVWEKTKESYKKFCRVSFFLFSFLFFVGNFIKRGTTIFMSLEGSFWHLFNDLEMRTAQAWCDIKYGLWIRFAF